MKSIYTLDEAVYKYGNESQKNAYEKAEKESTKGKGNLKTKQFTALTTSLKQHFKSVEVVGKGSKREFHCSGERFEVLDRKELQNYSNSGNRNQLSYKDDIRGATLEHLNKTNKITTTYRYLLKELTIVDDILHIASRKFSFQERKSFYDQLDDRYKVHGFAMFWEVVEFEHKRLTDNLKSVLRDMAGHKVIRLTDTINAVYIDEKGRKSHEPLHPIQAKEVDDNKRELREKYNVTNTELMFKPKRKYKAIEAYQEAEKEYLESLGIENVYDAVQVYIIATNREIKNYMDKALTKKIKEKHLQHAYEKALNRESEYSNSLLDILGGHKKPIYSLSDKPTQQEWIEYEKHNKTYANNFKETLKEVNNVK